MTWQIGECAMPGAVEIRDASGVTVAVVGADCPHIALIAAAPELFAACEKALNYITNTENSFGITLDTGIFLRAALALARGEQTEQSR